jgi:hypothetical protein
VAVIDHAETSLSRPRLKFLLGELVLGSWRPHLLVADPLEFGVVGWPDAPEIMQAALPADVDGFLCRKVDVQRFAPGIGRYGDFICYVQYHDVLHYVEIAGSFEDYLKRFSPKPRGNLARSVRHFLARDPQRNSCEIYTTPEEMARFQQEAAAISQETYQTRLLGSGFRSDAESLRGMVAAAERGDARGYLLRDGERAIAFAWCRRKGSSLVYDTIGYLPEFAKLSPGSVLLYLILEDLFSTHRYGILDFGPGEAQYKSMFGTGRYEFEDVYLFRRKLRHRALVSAHYRLGNLSSDVGAMLERHGLKKKIKKLIRILRT